jgi:DNA-directed RNA polymerase sigma subunit (sigma70/sigma32)
VQVSNNRFKSTEDRNNDLIDDGMTVGETLTYDGPLQDEIVHRSEISRKIRLITNRQEDKRSQAILVRISDKDNPKNTLDVIGKRFGVSRERIRQLENEVKRRMSNNEALKKLAGDL